MLLWWTALLCLLLNFIESSEIVGSDDETIFDIVPNLDDIDYLESINQTKCPLHLINFYGAKKIRKGTLKNKNFRQICRISEVDRWLLAVQHKLISTF